MNYKEMTKEELLKIKFAVERELGERLQSTYMEYQEKIIDLIRKFEDETNYYLVVDGPDYTDRAENFIRNCFYYTEEYIEEYC